MKKIDKILDMFFELLGTDMESDEAIFVVANSFYTSKDEKINKDTLFRYMKSHINMDDFHKALETRDLSIINSRYSKENIKKKESENQEKRLEEEKISEEAFKSSTNDIISEIKTLQEKMDQFVRNYPAEKKSLEIPSSIVNINEKSVRRGTFRIDEKLFDDFESFCKSHKEYNKTAIFNFMMEEFLNNYR